MSQASDASYPLKLTNSRRTRAFGSLLTLSCLLAATACSKSSDAHAGSAAADAAGTPAAAAIATDAPVAAATTSAAPAVATSAAETTAPAAPTAMTTAAVAFTDVAGNVNAPGIMSLAELGVLDSTSGAFRPNEPIKRRDFVRWLFKTNNAVFADSPAHVIHPADPSEASSFTDVAASDLDFAFVQGLADSGVSVGFPDKTFKGDRPITREQAIAIKSTLDHGGVDAFYAGKDHAGNAHFALPQWKDRDSVSITYVGAIAQDGTDEGDGKIDNIGRTFGAIAVFRPQATLSRGEAATMFGVIGGHAGQQMFANAMRTVAAALHPAPSASP